MQTRLDYGKAAPGSVQAMYKLQKYVDESGLEHSLIELVKTRVSQINGWNRLAISFRPEVMIGNARNASTRRAT
jgi:hypothetical protein